VTSVTLLWRHASILGVMIFLAAFSRLTAAPEAKPNDLLAKAHAAIGHLGLTIIALVFVLLNFWQG
jgi:uncharacterized membrane protein